MKTEQPIRQGGTSVKPMLNIRKASSDGRYTLVIQVLYKRKRGVIFTPYRLLPAEFDLKKGRAVAVNQRKAHVAQVKEINAFVQKQIEEIRRIQTKLEREGAPYTVNDLTQSYRQRYDLRYVRTFFLSQIAELKREQAQGTANNYHSTLVAFEKFSGGRHIHFDHVDEAMLMAFEEHLRQVPLQPNTVTFYMSNFRAVYNKAYKKGYISKGVSPFENMPMHIEKTRKLAVSAAVIRKVAAVNLDDDLNLRTARDLFMFSFYCRGMSFADMAFLRQEDIRDGVIYYRRRKTGQLYSVKIFPALQKLIDRYRALCSPWVCPVMLYRTEDGRARPLLPEGPSPEQKMQFEATIYKRYKYSLSHYLSYLSRLTVRLELQKKLSFNTARHSWASLARDSGIPVSVISVGLGHTSEKTTRIYLDELDDRKVHEANDVVVGLLEQEDGKQKRKKRG